MPKFSNDLVSESSPYLLQHAHNPVNWKPWCQDALQQAKSENKLLLISIGYSACHWCHVMAHESFENEETAKLMNANFINLKVDREERPDVDQVYMNALQLMTGRGGWPLNIIALPDGRPVWGGTYLRNQQWNGVLHQIKDLFLTAPEKMEEYAEKLMNGIKNMAQIIDEENLFSMTEKHLKTAVDKWKTRLDEKYGGTEGAPKFMMPNNYQFLLRYAFQTEDKQLLQHVDNTLAQISFGGIFDAIGGGFARYSTDEKWHVPHFEKMLYDNAQLISLYSDAYLYTKKATYKEVVYKTIEFVARELQDKTGAFYSALDADSLNDYGISEEGAFYVWEKEELQHLLGEDYALFAHYFNINEQGLWENGKYILIRKESDATIAQKHALTTQEVQQKIKSCTERVFQERKKRAKPGLDDKSITAWNALMIKAYCDAYRVFSEEKFLAAALKTADFLTTKQITSKGPLLRIYKKGKSTINAYLEDYAFCIEAFLALHEVTLDEKWLKTALQLTHQVEQNFSDSEKALFYFKAKQDEALITRTIEYQDNVIPSSNSVMAKNLFKLALYTGNTTYHTHAERMLKSILPQIEQYPEAYGNWLDLGLNFTNDFLEIVVTGALAKEKIQKLNQFYIPNKVCVGSKEKSNLALLKNRFQKDKTLIYICRNHHCQQPTENIETAISQMLHKN